MTALSNGLAEVGRYDEELTVLEAKYAYLKRNGGRISHIDVTMTNLAVCYSKLGRREEAKPHPQPTAARGCTRGLPPRDLRQQTSRRLSGAMGRT